MCYGTTYQCQITCVNTDLNGTLLQQGIVSGTGYAKAGCKLLCDAGKPILDQGSFDPVMPLSGMAVLVGIAMVLIVALTIYSWWTRDDGDL